MYDHPTLILSDHLKPYADQFRSILKAKIYAWEYTVDMKKALAAFPKLKREDVMELIKWYESNLISTTFEVVNDLETTSQ